MINTPGARAGNPGRGIDREAFAWVVLAVALVFTVFLWLYSSQSLMQRNGERFAYLAERETSTLVTRMQAYEQVLFGARALFASGEEVTRDEWHDYVTKLNLNDRLPGIQGTGFAVFVSRADKLAHIHEGRTLISPDYELRPAGDRDYYTPIVFLEPESERNRGAIGYDMFSNTLRREAMEYARDTGGSAITARVTLVQETDDNIQPGFLMYLPVYRKGMPLETLADRGKALFGFVYSPFRVHDLIHGVYGTENRDILIELYDGEPSAQSLLYADPQIRDQARFSVTRSVDIGGRQWTLHFHSSPNYERSTESTQPQLILIGGLTLDGLLFAITLMVARHARRMEDAARKLSQSRDRYLTLVENVPGTVFRAAPEPPWHFHHVSKHIRTLTGEPPESFIDGNLMFCDFIHPDDLARVTTVVSSAMSSHTPYEVEYRIRNKNSDVRWVNERGRGMYDENGRITWIDGVILDITERRLAENAIRDLAYYDPLTALPNRRLLDDRIRHAMLNSERNRQHAAILFIDMDNFKTINDNYGHDVGDLLLIEVARRLREAVREADTVARLGGDEFLVMLEELGPTTEEAESRAAQVAQKILASLDAPYLLGNERLHSTPSIGITTFCGQSQNVGTLIRQADLAMYEAKESGRNTVRTFLSAPPRSDL